MRIHILGSGTILSPAARNQAGYLLEKEGRCLLIDAGPGIMHRLIDMGMDVDLMDGILLSHFHLDHCSDVFPILMRRHFLSAGSLFLAGPASLSAWYGHHAGIQGDWLKKSEPRIVDLTTEKLTWTGCRITCMPNGHSGDSIAMRLSGDKEFFYSSDCEYSPELAGFAAGADCALVECSHPDGAGTKGHMTPSGTGRLAGEASVKHLVVTHIYPDNDTPYLKPAIQEHFHGNITIARDGLVIPL
jgi:ribonuclease BN (tRNA processing enzyme)